MVRGLLIVVVTLVVIIATVVGVVTAGLRRIAVANQQANAEWVRPAPVAPLTPATNPSADAQAAADIEEPVRTFESINLEAPDAVLHGNVQLVDPTGRGGRRDPVVDDRLILRRSRMGGRTITTYLTGFKTTDDYAEWPVNVSKAGEYEIDLTYACAKWQEGGNFTVKVGGKDIPLIAEISRSETSFRVVPLGKLTLPAGNTTLVLRSTPASAKAHTGMNVRGFALFLAPSTSSP